MAENNENVIDVERQSIRGRACPRCGGKIIPSLRAIYQSPADPSSVFPLWECERCGHAELSEKPAAPAKPAHKKAETPPKAEP
jgi:ribosomal protein L37AE/L43A